MRCGTPVALSLEHDDVSLRARALNWAPSEEAQATAASAPPEPRPAPEAAASTAPPLPGGSGPSAAREILQAVQQEAALSLALQLMPLLACFGPQVRPSARHCCFYLLGC